MEKVNQLPDAAARRSASGIAKYLGVCAMTAHRWMTVGNKYGVRLRYVVIGSTRYTCELWAREFVAETTKREEATRD